MMKKIKIPSTPREWLEFTIWISDGVEKGFIPREQAYELVKELEAMVADADTRGDK